ncbi:MAG: NAD-dependent deacylase [Ignavibacteriaceae bacterium]|nr:NAD-dependent deacylase [Ignavibacteriaceae bacterium]
MDIPSNVIEKLQSAKKIVFFSGAGISAESGIPTFRGKDGIWNKLSPEELANFNAFIKNPKLVWEWYNYRKSIVHQAKPNLGHLAIVEFENIFSEVIVITQNVDNLHRRAGSKKVYELHGNIERNFCIKCKKHYDGDLDFQEGVPNCSCGGLIRPDVVWFGEMLPAEQFRLSEKAAQSCDIFLIVGTSAVVYPAASLVYTAKSNGAFLVEVNIEETEVSTIVDVSLFGESGKILPKIVEQIKQIRINK